ncbi:MAG: hypothetical protein KKC76_08005 [Proteobacteria bacterium]|nr:hypothetical protein [Pseudomonadota bacterium]MBU4297181.1 hypothetical protein [Pseudomonadota bacterium]MCG2748784.1 hypothetical protein [Desulfobulbaceae bacterium]
MRKRYKNGLLVSALTTAVLMVGATAFAHPGTIPLRDTAGNLITNTTTPYSPKKTCGACHNTVVNYDIDGRELDEAVSVKGSYDGGGATKTVVKTQGIQNQATGEAEWVTFETTAYKHGFVVGRHSQEGRNEDYGNHLRHAVHGKFWANATGMFGKY